MCKLNKHNDGRNIDPCMKNLIKFLNHIKYKTLACCCGHGKHPITIVVKTDWNTALELLHDVEIPRKKRFYKKDKEGYYFIPEVL